VGREREKTRDATLVAAGLRGDRQALEELVQYYYGPVYQAAFRILGDVETSADVTQATFLAAFENLRSYDSTYKFFSWIYRIAVNQALSQRRKDQIVVEKMYLQSAHVADEGPEQALGEQQTGSLVKQLLGNMPDDYRTVLIVRHYSELSYDEIADVLEIPVKTVRSRLYSARQLLKSSLQENGYDL